MHGPQNVKFELWTESTLRVKNQLLPDTEHNLLLLKCQSVKSARK